MFNRLCLSRNELMSSLMRCREPLWRSARNEVRFASNSTITNRPPPWLLIVVHWQCPINVHSWSRTIFVYYYNHHVFREICKRQDPYLISRNNIVEHLKRNERYILNSPPLILTAQTYGVFRPRLQSSEILVRLPLYGYFTPSS